MQFTVLAGLVLTRTRTQVQIHIIEISSSIGDTSITLESSVSWKVGSRIVLATTDYPAVLDYRTLPSNTSMQYQRGLTFPDQTEVLTIASVDGKIVTFQEPLRYMHWG